MNGELYKEFMNLYICFTVDKVKLSFFMVVSRGCAQSAIGNLHVVKSSFRPEFQVAAQNCWLKKGGAYTGEVR